MSHTLAGTAPATGMVSHVSDRPSKTISSQVSTYVIESIEYVSTTRVSDSELFNDPAEIEQILAWTKSSIESGGTSSR